MLMTWVEVGEHKVSKLRYPTLPLQNLLIIMFQREAPFYGHNHYTRARSQDLTRP
jgi:hypothetical protein